jgi:hypothetical protein
MHAISPFEPGKSGRLAAASAIVDRKPAAAPRTARDIRYIRGIASMPFRL